jgi:hypothetical protein
MTAVAENAIPRGPLLAEDGRSLEAEEFLNELVPGRMIGVDYGERPLVFHERVLLAPAAPVDGADPRAVWECMTPELDYTEEDVLCLGGGTLRCVLLPTSGRSLDFMKGRFYRFRWDDYPEDKLLVSTCRATMKATVQSGGRIPLLVRYVKRSGDEGRLVGVPKPAGRTASALVVGGGGLPPDGGDPGGGGGGGPAPQAPVASALVPAGLPAGAGAATTLPSGMPGAGRVWLLSEIGHPVLSLGAEVRYEPGDLVPAERILLKMTSLGTFYTARSVVIEEAPGFVEGLKRKYESAFGPAVTPRGGASGQPAHPGALALGDASEPEAGAKGKGVGGPEPELDDARVLWLDYDAQGTRYKAWRDCVRESFTEPLRCPEVEGPTGAHHLMKHFVKVGGDPRRWLESFCREHGIARSDRVFHEITCLTEVLFLLGTFDQVNVPSLAGGERLCRRIVSIIDAYSRGGVPNWKLAKFYDGNAADTDAIDPGLRLWSQKMAKDEGDLGGTRGKGDAADAGAGGGGGAKGDGRPQRDKDKKGDKGAKGDHGAPAQPPKPSK